MTHTRYLIAVSLAGLLVIGGGCFSKTTVVTNTNTGVLVTTNTSVTTNSGGTTGSFGTSVDVSAGSTVTISSSGVSPSTVTVAKGTTVKFTNNDSVSHQISSNPHPVHSDVPGFNGAAAPSGTYSFTFTQSGTFGYHDHLDPFNAKWKGTVVVQ